MEKVSAEDLKLMMDRNEKIVLLDVRGDDAYAEDHIAGAKSAPLGGGLKERVDCCTVEGAKLVTYCGSSECPMSEKAAARLEDMGYKNVHRYQGGIKEWKEKGFPTENGK